MECISCGEPLKNGPSVISIPFEVCSRMFLVTMRIRGVMCKCGSYTLTANEMAISELMASRRLLENLYETDNVRDTWGHREVWSQDLTKFVRKSLNMTEEQFNEIISERLRDEFIERSGLLRVIHLINQKITDHEHADAGLTWYKIRDKRISK